MDRIGYATRRELLERAKELNITGRWDMTKGELLVAVQEAMKHSEQVDDGQYRDAQVCQKTTLDYAKDVSPGTIIAFKVMLGGKQRVLSAKVNGKNQTGCLLVETKNGSKYRVGPDDVVWVKTGLRCSSKSCSLAVSDNVLLIFMKYA